MRILTAINVFDEVGPGQYRENSISKRLMEPGQAAGFQLMYALPITTIAKEHDLILLQRRVGVAHR